MFDDALGTRLFADDAQDLLALRLQHDDVTGRFGFEFVEHGWIVRVDEWLCLFFI